MKKILAVFGTRPEAIKMCPVVKELKKHKGFETVVCITGQHKEMLWPILDTFHIIPHYDLDIMEKGQTLFDITEKVMSGIRSILEKEKPVTVLVHGDTTSAFAAALAGYYLNVPVCHVEAGLRTYDHYSPFPEEFNRLAVDAVSDLFFAPTEKARDNLIKEGKSEKAVYVTGNTVIDALRTTIYPGYTHEILQWAGKDRLILLTAHRRENLGNAMRDMFLAVRDIVSEYEDVRVVYPVHLNPMVRKTANEVLGKTQKVMLTEPLNVMDFHNIMERCYFVVTDSGGIQEEAPSLGKPVLVMRDVTERPEGVEAGTLKLVGTSRQGIKKAMQELLTDKEMYGRMSAAVNPYGDGRASERIARIISDRWRE